LKTSPFFSPFLKYSGNKKRPILYISTVKVLPFNAQAGKTRIDAYATDIPSATPLNCYDFITKYVKKQVFLKVFP
jgi:hypothetical protein